MTPGEIKTIKQAKKTFLYQNDTKWVKKGSANFDVAMGAYDGAETCDLIGLFLLYEMKEIKAAIGLYRDDGLAVIEGTPREIEKVKQRIAQIFNKHGLKISIMANSSQVDFLDVTLNLENGTFRPFIKPGDKTLYVHSKSNHPPTIIKNIPCRRGIYSK